MKDSTSQPIVFQFSKAEVRINTDEQGQPWFNGIDVCSALGYSNGRDAISRHVDEEDVAKHDTLSEGGMQQHNYVNESGLYALIFGSKLESAKAFKRWVTSEVLPALRKRGHFGTLALKDRLAVSRHVKGLMKDLLKMDDAFGYELLSNEINDLMTLAGLQRPDLEKLGTSRKEAH